MNSEQSLGKEREKRVKGVYVRRTPAAPSGSLPCYAIQINLEILRGVKEYLRR